MTNIPSSPRANDPAPPQAIKNQEPSSIDPNKNNSPPETDQTSPTSAPIQPLAQDSIIKTTILANWQKDHLYLELQEENNKIQVKVITNENQYFIVPEEKIRDVNNHRTGEDFRKDIFAKYKPGQVNEKRSISEDFNPVVTKNNEIIFIIRHIAEGNNPTKPANTISEVPHIEVAESTSMIPMLLEEYSLLLTSNKIPFPPQALAYLIRRDFGNDSLQFIERLEETINTKFNLKPLPVKIRARLEKLRLTVNTLCIDNNCSSSSSSQPSSSTETKQPCSSLSSLQDAHDIKFSHNSASSSSSAMSSETLNFSTTDDAFDFTSHIEYAKNNRIFSLAHSIENIVTNWVKKTRELINSSMEKNNTMNNTPLLIQSLNNYLVQTEKLMKNKISDFILIKKKSTNLGYKHIAKSFNPDQLHAYEPLFYEELNNEIACLTNCIITPLKHVYQDLANSRIQSFLRTIAQDNGKLLSIDNVDLIKIEVTDSDPHNKGQRVVILTFNCGGTQKKLVYKPRDIRIDDALVGKHSTDSPIKSLSEITNEMLETPSSSSLSSSSSLPTQPLLPTYRFLPCRDEQKISEFSTANSESLETVGHYGYVEHLEHFRHEDCVFQTNEEAANFYHNVGRLHAMMYLFGVSDIHQDNLLTHKKQPYLIDLEIALKADCLKAPLGKPVELGFSNALTSFGSTEYIQDTIGTPDALDWSRGSESFDKKPTVNWVYSLPDNQDLCDGLASSYTASLDEGFQEIINIYANNTDKLLTFTDLLQNLTYRVHPIATPDQYEKLKLLRMNNAEPKARQLYEYYKKIPIYGTSMVDSWFYGDIALYTRYQQQIFYQGKKIDEEKINIFEVLKNRIKSLESNLQNMKEYSQGKTELIIKTKYRCSQPGPQEENYSAWLWRNRVMQSIYQSSSSDIP